MWFVSNDYADLYVLANVVMHRFWSMQAADSIYKCPTAARNKQELPECSMGCITLNYFTGKKALNKGLR
jgi:hypothetical protein